ncbi:MAG: diacylglycerol kinase family lipid kinase, partial [Evtepia sp.]
KNLLGYTAYLFESVKYWGSLKPYHVRIQYDHEQTLEGDYLYVMVSNSTSVGRIRNFPPGNPLLDDGLLEVTLISKPKDIFELEQLSRMLIRADGKIGSPMLKTFSASHVQFETNDDVAWTLDGEYGGQHRIAEVEVLPHAFTILHGK